jgi:hypothetical protein
MPRSGSEEWISRSNLDRRFVVSSFLTPVHRDRPTYLDVGGISRTR